MRYSDHRLWRIYETVTAVAGLGVLASLVWVIGKIFFQESMPEWPLVGEVSHWLIGGVSWIVKADIIKYRITRDPRDHPFRKWLTVRNLKRYKYIYLRKGKNPLNIKNLITMVCPSCDSLHGFEKSDKQPRICGHNGCHEVIQSPDL